MRFIEDEEAVEIDEEIELLMQLSHGIITRQEYEEKLEILQEQQEKELETKGLLAQ